MAERGSDSTGNRTAPSQGRSRRRRQRRPLLVSFALLGFSAILLLAAAVWLASRAAVVKNELGAATELISVLKADVADNNSEKASATVGQLRTRTGAARDAVDDPLWTLASVLPGLGPNFSAVAEVARSADDVSALGVAPLIKVFSSLNWETLVPKGSATDLQPLKSAALGISSAAHAVSVSSDRLNRIDASRLLPQVAGPLTQAREQLQSVTGTLSASADAARIAPAMLGADAPRHYLLMIQNNAEARATGGIPGALAILTLDKGQLTLGEQSTAGDVGVLSPPIPIDTEQQQIYSARIGKFMQDVNLTPDFPTTASTAQSMWQKKYGKRVAGVISIDPVALGYLLDATGPVRVSSIEPTAQGTVGLPTELNGKNVVRTLLSDVYAKIEQPRVQDAYFAGVAREIFTALSSGKGDSKSLIEGITRGAAEGRVLLWSGQTEEQAVLGKYSVSGSVSGPSISPTQFGVYFNDGTGAKMDYHVKRTVQLIRQCPADGYSEVKVRITSTNTAPKDAATSLPEYVTGGATFGVPAGNVQTNIVAYGPVQSNVEAAFIGGKKTGFAPQRHAGRPVGTVTVRLAPGQSSVVEFTFGKIVQHTDPVIAVTPTVQALKDVVLATEGAKCSN